jgi:cytoplasmic iron level regulating protein YaaA (DUF328/UPF0246 family)
MKQHANKGASHLGKLLNISTSLSQTALKYWESIQQQPSSSDNPFPQKPCGFSFDGVAYKGLDVTSLSVKEIMYLQHHVRTIDPLYGKLRPMDTIEPYRLEMATKGVFDGTDTKPDSKSTKNTSLAEFWKPAIRESFHREETENGKSVVIINLASDEYSAAVDWPRIVKVVFQHGGRVIAVHAKRARGLMVRYMAQNSVQTLDGLSRFDVEGYSFDPKESSSSLSLGEEEEDFPKTLVFNRPADWNRTSNKKKKKSNGYLLI